MTNTYPTHRDLEASKEKTLVSTSPDHLDIDSYDDASGVHDQDVYSNWYGRLFAPLWKVELLLDRKLGVEARGPARVLPHEREAPQYWNMASLWASAVTNLAPFSTGLIASELGLDLKRGVTIAIFATVIGGLLTAWCATQGPKTGLRQISIARYSFGWWPSKLIAILNFVEQFGWASVACITGGLALTAVSDGSVSLALGVVIVAVVGSIISFIGLRFLLSYERYAWIPIFIIFLIMYGMVGPHMDNVTPPVATGVDLSAAALTFFAIVYGSTASWTSVVSDYYVQFPADTPDWKTFVYTWCGLVIPTCFANCLGVCVGSAVLGNEDWSRIFHEDGLGYLIQAILFPKGFAKFLLVILILSGIGNVCICVYCASLAAQQFAHPMMAVPRTVWTVIVLAIILVLGLVGRDHLLAVLQNFLSLLGYWNSSYFVILFTEHYLFRYGNYDDYNLNAWNDESRLPVGLAGFFAFALGVAGWIMGMSETWYVGIIARRVGTGGDIGPQLGFGFTLISYAPARWLEYKWLGR